MGTRDKHHEGAINYVYIIWSADRTRKPSDKVSWCTGLRGKHTVEPSQRCNYIYIIWSADRTRKSSDKVSWCTGLRGKHTVEPSQRCNYIYIIWSADHTRKSSDKVSWHTGLRPTMWRMEWNYIYCHLFCHSGVK